MNRGHVWKRLKEVSADDVSAIFPRAFLVFCEHCFAQETQYERPDRTTLETGARRCDG
jgi:hypothetical protein